MSGRFVCRRLTKIIVFFITFIYRALSKIIGWCLIRKFNIKIRVGRISFPFSLRDVNICKNGFTVVSYFILCYAQKVSF